MIYIRVQSDCTFTNTQPLLFTVRSLISVDLHAFHMNDFMYS